MFNVSSVFLEGKIVRLRPLQESDVEGPYPSWLNSQQITAHNGHGLRPYSSAAARAFIEDSNRSEDRIVLAVEDRASGRHIGNVSLQSIHLVYRNAELAILLGDPTCHGKGVGLECCRLLVEHGFLRLNLHRIHLGTFSTNLGMIRIAQKLGMKEEGRRREAVFKNGVYVDVLEFGLLRSEFKASMN
jgi:ribosomal-protein-alanine N-acetyltransferase